jgi:hypothetical protein
MECTQQKEILKDLTTAVKFIRIAKTMLNNIKTKVYEENPNSLIADRLNNYVECLEGLSKGWNDYMIEEFKSQQKMSGAQLKLF